MNTTNNPVHLAIADTYLAANSDVDAPYFRLRMALGQKRRHSKRRRRAAVKPTR